MLTKSGFKQFSRRQILAGLLVSAASGALAGAPNRSIRPKARVKRIALLAAGPVEPIIQAAGLSGKVGFVVADAQSGEVLESRNPLLTFPPASVTKTATTLYGLKTLGNSYRFNTRIIVTGPLKDGKIKGDLYLAGGGDPTLDTDALADMAKQLKAAGVEEVTGRTYVYSAALPYQKAIDPSQPVYLGYDPSLSGLNLNYNRVFFQWTRQKSGYQITMDARALKFRPRVAMASMKVVNRRTPVFTLETGATSDSWTVAKRALGRKGGRWLPVRRPEYYAADVFRTLARSYGIVLPPFKTARTLPDGTVLADWKSDNLPEVLRKMLKYSTNLTAEAVGLTASYHRGASPATLRASAKIMTAWIKETSGARHVRFVDHSGLGDENRASTSDMVKILKSSGWDGPLHQLMKDIKLHDKNGRPLKKQKINVRAKTGTLNFVSALAGYIDPPNGRKLIFAIFCGDLPRREMIPKSQKERPKGARGWNHRAKVMQQQLIERWVAVL